MLFRHITMISLSAALTLSALPVSAQGVDAPAAGAKSGAGWSAYTTTRRSSSHRHKVAPNLETMTSGSGFVRERGGRNKSCAPQRGSDLPFSITVDGQALNGDGSLSSADSQRCTDKALARADIQVRYDGLDARPRLNVVAAPNAVRRGGAVSFSTYSNYQLWLARGEIRVFASSKTARQKPLAVLGVAKGVANWQVPETAGNELHYVLRVYDSQGRFDETAPKALKLAERRGAVRAAAEDLAVVYGGDALKIRNIPVYGGSVLVSGRDVAPDHDVNVMGFPVPVDAKGDFAIRQILPPGRHEVNVAVLDERGVVSEFSREATIPEHDFFYVALADLTAGRGKASAAAAIVRPDKKDEYSKKTFVNGRLAFYLKGKIRGQYLLTASADTKDQPIKYLFSNFDAKDPRFLLRQLDPNRYYPVYGDDSTTIDDAPTRGKFYVKLERGDSSIMWGNFKTSINGTQFVRYSRGLYGARAKLVTDSSTSHGERRGKLEAFGAQPGTIGARDVFRGTGGSHYYLRRQNITQGSERVVVEVRDRNTDLVLSTKTLNATEDYEVNYLQGRLTLRQPLASTASDDFIVSTGSLSGHKQYIVVTYEFAPGLTQADDRVAGGRASYWLNDYVQVGASGYEQREPGKQQKLLGADVTLRYAPGTYIKLEGARSNGPGSGEAVSIDGGFTFTSRAASGRKAWAKRVEAAMDLSEVFEGREGRLSAYWQHKQRGFSGPGQLAIDRAVREIGAQAKVKVSNRIDMRVRADEKRDDLARRRTGEVNVDLALSEHWSATIGARSDDNKVLKPSASQTLNRAGSRTDLAARLRYDSKNDWTAYVFAQGTVHKSGTRKGNNRAGVGGETRLSQKLTASAEISGGDGGLGAKVGTQYEIDDKKTVYLNYTLDTDSTEIVSRGGEGRLTSGARVRFNDTLSVFGEERWHHAKGFSGLTHAYGLDFVPVKHWKTNLAFELGKIQDVAAGDVDRLALSTTIGYAADGLSYTGKLEYRRDKTTSSKRDTYLMRNALSAKMSNDWRFVGRLNGSYSTSTLGDFYDGNFAEGIAGFAYRPTRDDRLNMLFKYSFLYELPSAGQITGAGVVADFAQRSHVVSIDGAYDLTPWLTIGGKYAYRMGALRDNRIGGMWFDSRAQLAIGRLDLHVVKKWDVVGEIRWLQSSTAKDRRLGALIAAYRHMGDNFKFGVGYNFTDFSDDLTNLDYNNKGVFVNAIAKF